MRWCDRAIVVFVVAFLLASGAHAAPKERTLVDMPSAFKQSHLKLLPLPVFETDPASGQRYGFMPTFLWLDPEDQLLAIGIAAMTYNPTVVKLGGYGGLFLYPSDRERLRFFYETAQNYTRDYYVEYANERWLDGKLGVEGEFEYLIDPFERFFGFGPETIKAAESNFVSRTFFWRGGLSYEFFPDVDFGLEERWTRMLLRPRALNRLADTADAFSARPEVRSSNQWDHRLAVVWDTRDSDDFPTKGHELKSYLLLSHEPFGGASFYHGYGFLAKKLFTFKERFTTIAVFRTDQVFGDQVPFYMQPALGGEMNLRGFVRRRFAGRGQVLFDLEERIRIKRWNIMNVKFDVSLDPFFSVGQVFDDWSEVRFAHLKPVGGMGFRAKALPSVVGRIDIGVGQEGVEVFMTLGYPF